jgi:hypothetical protein
MKSITEELAEQLRITVKAAYDISSGGNEKDTQDILDQSESLLARFESLKATPTENAVLAEIGKPLTEKGWERIDKKKALPRYRKNGSRNTYDAVSAAQQQAFFNQPILIAEINRLQGIVNNLTTN